jgi:O-antigen ligase
MLLFSGTVLSLKLIKVENKVVLNSINNKLNYVSNFFRNDKKANNKEINTRTLINQCSKTLFLERPLFGYGLGEQHIYLTGCYAQKKEFVLVEKNFNTHNHYYFLLLSGGMLVFLPFVFMLIFFLKLALKTGNQLFVLFLILMVFNLLIENILTRINGILFFSLFLPLLYRYITKNYKEI